MNYMLDSMFSLILATVFGTWLMIALGLVFIWITGFLTGEDNQPDPSGDNVFGDYERMNEYKQYLKARAPSKARMLPASRESVALSSFIKYLPL